MSAVIVPLEPKSKQGTKHGVSWLVSYDTTSKKFNWTVTVTVKPQTFSGACGTMKEAEQEIEAVRAYFK